MRLSPIQQIFALVLAGASCAACDSPAQSACKRAEECGLFDSDETYDACVKEVEKELPAGQLEECANCLDDHSCSEIKDDACEKACDD